MSIGLENDAVHLECVLKVRLGVSKNETSGQGANSGTNDDLSHDYTTKISEDNNIIKKKTIETSKSDVYSNNTKNPSAKPTLDCTKSSNNHQTKYRNNNRPDMKPPNVDCLVNNTCFPTTIASHCQNYTANLPKSANLLHRDTIKMDTFMTLPHKDMSDKVFDYSNSPSLHAIDNSDSPNYYYPIHNALSLFNTGSVSSADNIVPHDANYSPPTPVSAACEKRMLCYSADTNAIGTISNVSNTQKSSGPFFKNHKMSNNTKNTVRSQVIHNQHNNSNSYIQKNDCFNKNTNKIYKRIVECLSYWKTPKAENSLDQTFTEASADHPAINPDHYKSYSNSFDLIMASKSLRDFVDDEIYLPLSNDEKLKQEVLFEIFKSELHYRQIISSTFAVFYQPLSKLLSVTFSNDANSRYADRISFIIDMLNDLKSIIDISNEFVDHLSYNFYVGGYKFPNPSLVFLRIIDNIVTTYSNYTRKLAIYKLVITKLEDLNLFKKVLASCERDPRLKKFTLSYVVYLPTGRLAQYKLLLNKLHDFSQHDNNEANLLRTVSSSIDSLLTDIDTIIMKELMAPRFRHLARQIYNHFGNNCLSRLIQRVDPSSLIFEGCIYFTDSDFNCVLVDAYLMSTHLIISKVSPKKYSYNDSSIITIPCPIIKSLVTGTDAYIMYQSAIRAYLSVKQTTATKKTNKQRSRITINNNESVFNANFPNHDLDNYTVKKSKKFSIIRKGSLAQDSSHINTKNNDWFAITLSVKDNVTFFFKVKNNNDINIWYTKLSEITCQNALLPNNFLIKRLNVPCFDSKKKIFCALRHNNILLLGLASGLYMGVFTEPSSSHINDDNTMYTPSHHCDYKSLIPRFFNIFPMLEYVTKIFSMPCFNVLIIKTRKTLWVCPLNVVSYCNQSVKLNPDCCRKIIDNIDDVYMSTYKESTLFIVTKKVSGNTIISTYKPVKLPNKEDYMVTIFSDISCDIIPDPEYKKLYAPGRVTNVNICDDMLIVDSNNNRSLDVIEFSTRRTHEYPSHVDSLIQSIRNDASTKALYLFKLEDNLHILCYNNCAIYFNSNEYKIRDKQPIYWIGKPHTIDIIVKCEKKYIIALGSDMIEIWDAIEGKYLQNILLNDASLISTACNDLLFVADDENDPNRQAIYSLLYNENNFKINKN